MSTPPDEAWIRGSNETTLQHIEIQGRSGPGLVPFLGAGVSIPYGFKGWRDILLNAAPPSCARTVLTRLDKNDYEGAAEALLENLGSDGFQNMVAAAAGDALLERVDLRSGTPALLPLLATGPVITTNFDRLAERSFMDNGAPFEAVISGPRPDLIVDALHRNRHVLIKLHGDWQDRVGRTFARSDYDTNYGRSHPERKRELLDSAERLLFSARSLLFIGASLGPDRTVRLLQEVHKEYAGIRHFAVVPAPATRRAFESKEEQLRACGVMPLWYRVSSGQNQAKEVEALLSRVVERISVRTIGTGLTQAPPRRRAPHPARPPLDEPAPDGLDQHFERVVRLIEDGRLTFFLGAAIHAPTKLMAQGFYEALTRLFECEALQVNRPAVAQYIADRYGRESLDREVRKLFERTPLVARETHWLFADWTRFRYAGRPLAFPTIITTNYDDVLECVLADAGVPYHLLSYQATGPDRGLFYHRSPDDVLRVIERPQNIRRLDGGMVLVKLNGGFDRQRRIPVTFCTARFDYLALAARIPDVLPAAVRSTLANQPLLFLGSGFQADDIEAIVRFAHRDHPGSRSWAVVLWGLDPSYWRQNGVEILDREVGPYVRELHRRLLGVGRTGSSQ